tara:strand:+ start:262 stop:510 length:249 start_codon:yes stop_codon:yes gene_type:complete
MIEEKCFYFFQKKILGHLLQNEPMNASTFVFMLSSKSFENKKVSQKKQHFLVINIISNINHQRHFFEKNLLAYVTTKENQYS